MHDAIGDLLCDCCQTETMAGRLYDYTLLDGTVDAVCASCYGELQLADRGLKR